MWGTGEGRGLEESGVGIPYVTLEIVSSYARMRGGGLEGDGD